MVDIKAYIERISKLLPNIRPLKSFLHLNMFPDLLDHNFWDAVEKTQRSYNWHPFHSVDTYKQLFTDGFISKEQISKLIEHSNFSLDVDRDIFREEKLVSLSKKAYRPLHQCLNRQLETSLNELVEPLLIRFLASFFDQGVSESCMLFNNTGLFESFKIICSKSFLPLYPVKKTFFDDPRMSDPESVIQAVLPKLLNDSELFEPYIRECVLSLKGWTGLIKTLQNEPGLLQHNRSANLLEFVATRLIMEISWIERLCPDFIPLTKENYMKEEGNSPLALTSEDLKLFQLCQKALERTYLSKVVPIYLRHISCNNVVKQPKYQAIFCIDDRECFLRYSLEKIEPEISTYGSAGHFGLDFNLKYGDFGHPVKHCPAPILANFTLTKKNPRKRKPKFRWGKKSHFLREYLDLFFGQKMSCLVNSCTKTRFC